MTDAIRDQNHQPVWLAASYLDGVTPVPIVIGSVSGGVKVDTTHTIGFTPTPIDPRDANHVPFICALGDDGNVYPLFADPATGAVLVDQ